MFFRKKILIRYHDPDLKEIEVFGKGDWIDLRAAEDVIMTGGADQKISLGVSMKLPRGYEAHVKPRSSTYKHWNILMVNEVATIDNCYCGDDDIWFFHALATSSTTIHKNDRICQFRIVKKQPKIYLKTVAFLKGPNRGGWGSTGKQ